MNRHSLGALFQIGSKPDGPNMSFNLVKNTLWSTVSNAADMSRRTSITGLP